MAGLEGYASPNLRKSVFDRMWPGSVVEYEVVPMAEAFPATHQEYRGKATHAIRCTIIKPDGSYVVGCKEIDLVEERNGKAIEQTPEQYTKDQTKALGRALRDAGIPQKVDELQSQMRWLVALNGQPVISASGKRVDMDTGELQGSEDPDHVDEPDAGVDEPTDEQKLAARIGNLNGADKVALGQFAKGISVSNPMKAGEHVAAINEFLDTLHADSDRGDPE